MDGITEQANRVTLVYIWTPYLLH